MDPDAILKICLLSQFFVLKLNIIKFQFYGIQTSIQPKKTHHIPCMTLLYLYHNLHTPEFEIIKHLLNQYYHFT